MRPLIHALIGPTASGKEAAALEVARRTGAEILSLDSMKLYRGMEIGTAKADAMARDAVPHHLLDLADPAESFSARRWLTAAEEAVDDVCSRGRIPLFVGGTALYLKTLLHGLFEGPEARPEIRERMRSVLPHDLHRKLAEVDPVTAAKVHPHDVRRVVRALEVFEVTGQPVSRLRTEWTRDARPARLAGIRRTREDLYRRLEDRVGLMVEAGLLEEVRALLARPGGLGPVARQALGYKEIADYLEGAIPSLEEAMVLLTRRTKSFARRQITWFKHFDVEWVEVGRDEGPGQIADRVLGALEML